jgi:hypothetical protein
VCVTPVVGLHASVVQGLPSVYDGWRACNTGAGGVARFGSVADVRVRAARAGGDRGVDGLALGVAGVDGARIAVVDRGTQWAVREAIEEIASGSRC